MWGGQTGYGPGWALELDNGARCIVNQGTSPIVAGITMYYSCDGGGDAGGLNQHGSTWTIDYLPPHSTGVAEVSVATAWGG
ncbi:hypothetical protein GCM10027572_07740 [Flexivirga lutea]